MLLHPTYQNSSLSIRDEWFICTEIGLGEKGVAPDRAGRTL